MLIPGIAIGFWMSATQAATIYDEAVQGDLDFVTQPTLALALGSNTVGGSAFNYGPSSGFGDDFDLDPFSFTVPAGAQVESVTFGFSTQLLGGIQNSTVKFRLADANYQPITTTADINLFGASPVTIFGDVVPIPDGLYRWDEAGWGNHITTASSWTYDITFEVATVPVPAAFGLMAGALSLLLPGARRRRNA